MKIIRVEQQFRQTGLQKPKTVAAQPAFKGMATPVMATSVPVGLWKASTLRFGESQDPALPERPINVWEDSVNVLPESLIKALQTAYNREPVVLTTAHLLLEMLNDPKSTTELDRVLKQRFRVPPAQLKEALIQLTRSIDTQNNSEARRFSDSSDKKQARFHPALVEIFQNLKAVKDQLDKAGAEGRRRLNLEDFMLAVLVEGTSEACQVMKQLSMIPNLSPEALQGQEEKSPLEFFSRDLTFEAAIDELPPVIGRDNEFQHVLTTLGMKNTPNPILIGERGVGKTAIAEKLAQYLVKGENLPPQLVRKDPEGNIVKGPDGKPLGKRLLEIKWSQIEAKSDTPNKFKEIVDAIVEEAAARRGEVLLYIDEIHRINDKMSFNKSADMLKPPLARGQISILGATTDVEYRRDIEPDGALVRRFVKVPVPEPTVDQTLTMLRGARSWYENRHAVTDPETGEKKPLVIRDDALESSIKNAKRYAAGDALPSSAFKLLDFACSKVNTEASIGSLKRIVARGQVHQLTVDIEEGLNRRLKQIQEDKGQIEKRIQSVFDNYPRELRSHFNNWRVQNEHSFLKEMGLTEALFREIIQEITDGKYATWSEAPSEKERLAKLVVEFDAQQTSPEIASIPADRKRIAGIERLEKEIARSKEEKEAELKKNQAILKDSEDFLRTVQVKDILQSVELQTHIPVAEKEKQDAHKQFSFDKRIGKRLIGQNIAVQAVTRAIERNSSGFRDSKRPISSFIFMGPTGVGKTELAKTIAEELFGDENALIRFDMSEYQQEHQVTRLTGAPPSYVGFEQGGQLTNAVKERPYSVVLFDEIEKAHPKIWDVLLQILEDGRLTSGKGEEVSFKDTIIVVTSNIGGPKLLAPFRQSAGKLDPSLNAFKLKCESSQRIALQELRTDPRIRPEFIPRFDDIIAFHPLMRADLNKIADVLINKLNKDLKDKKLTIKLEQDAKDYMVEQCFSFDEGGRKLRKFIDNIIKTALGRMYSREEIFPGETLNVSREMIERWQKDIEAEKGSTS